MIPFLQQDENGHISESGYYKAVDRFKDLVAVDLFEKVQEIGGKCMKRKYTILI